MTTFTTEDRENAMQKPYWEQGYDDWVKLLERANAINLLDDPKAIWDEAWRAATMVITNSLQDKELAQKIERKMLK
jgi:hypothetical protein